MGPRFFEFEFVGIRHPLLVLVTGMDGISFGFDRGLNRIRVGRAIRLRA